MPTPQLLNDVISLLLLLAPSAALVSLVLAGVTLRREGGDGIRHRWRVHEMDVLGSGVSYAAAPTDLVLFVRNQYASARWRNQHAMASQHSVGRGVVYHQFCRRADRADAGRIFCAARNS